MWIKVQLAFRSYKPIRVEKGQLYLIVEDKLKYAYPQIVELSNTPSNPEEWLQNNGYPVELYIVDPGDANIDKEWVLATPDQIGWMDEGSHTDELCDITLKHINTILRDYDSWVAIEVEEIEDVGQDVYYPYKAIIFQGKAIIRFVDEYLYDDFDEEEEEEEEEQEEEET